MRFNIISESKQSLGSPITIGFDGVLHDPKKNYNPMSGFYTVPTT